MTKTYLSGLLSALFFIFSFAQNNQTLYTVQSHLSSKAPQLGLSVSDISDLTIQTDYTNKKTNIQHVYVQQNVDGYPVYNAIANFALKNGEVVYMTQTFQGNTKLRKVAVNPVTDVESIAAVIAQNLGYVLNETAFLNTDFENQLLYYPADNNKLLLSRVIHLNVNEDDQPKILEIVANAQTGEIYSQHNQLLSCNFEPNAYENPITIYKESENINWLNQMYTSGSTLNDGAKYRVFDLPKESPNFGDRSLLVNPADPDASPYGWHDVNGEEGPEYTSTRGNNVIAINDQNSIGLSWIYGGGGSLNYDDVVEGGPDLDFDFPLNIGADLYLSAEASTTNLFYMNNMMHDVTYQYGFTEEAGNFQVNNYGQGGNGNDEVFALGQTGESIGSMNNAMFGTPPDGSNPYMVMFMWATGQGDSHLFSVDSPGPHQGNYNGILAGFGANLPNPPITDELAVIKDDTSNPNEGCGNVTNAAELNGKIVLIKRGNCDFVVKVKKAQIAGAKAVVMVNNVGGEPIAMGGSDPTINIPSVMIRQNDGNPIIDAVLDGETLIGSVPKEGHHNGYKDGSFDNGIIAHEYGHGISNRLTGGPMNTSCLNNDEQMGEGWSDYFGLVLTMEPGDQGADGRGIGTYAMNQQPTGPGIRPTRYSTNMSINPSTYNTIKNVAIPHGVGYVWATMLWEMTWELIDVYGFDPDIYHGTGGNNVALQLVMDGMKLQPCRPGFVSGRDAILQADIINNDGVNQCRIWKAFAKRGLGYEANEGNTNSVYDGIESFDMPPQNVLDCSNMDVNDLTLNSLSIYPNPTKGEFYILTEKPHGESAVSIKDLTGKEVLNTNINLANKRASIDVSNLPSGVYVVSINTDNEVVTKKLIKK